MTRHPDNTNLTLHYEDNYLGLPVQSDKGPFVREYLDRLYLTCDRALTQYPRVFAFRFDLRFPAWTATPDYGYANQIIERFIASFKAKIKHNRQLAQQDNKYAHDSVVRYAWARELGEKGSPHYHVAILLNYDAFCALGKFEAGRDNIFNRLEEAWASALSLSREWVTGLVHIPENPAYVMHRNDIESQAEFFRRASYLCKAATKTYGDGAHGFGASRI